MRKVWELDVTRDAPSAAIDLNFTKTAEEGTLFIVKNGELVPAESP